MMTEEGKVRMEKWLKDNEGTAKVGLSLAFLTRKELQECFEDEPTE